MASPESPEEGWGWSGGTGLGGEPRAGRAGVRLSPGTTAGHSGHIGAGPQWASEARMGSGQGYGWGEGTEGFLRCSTQRVLRQENTYSGGATKNQENKV